MRIWNLLGTVFALLFPPLIRITTLKEEARTVITIDGQFADSDLEEVQRVRKSSGGKVVLNLSGLFACSAEGIRFLKVWRADGAQLERANPFLQMIFEAQSTGLTQEPSDKANEAE